MTAHKAVLEMEKMGCIIETEGQQIDVYYPDGVTVPGALLDALRANMAEAINHLRYRGFEEVPAADGEAYTVEFKGQDALQRWGTAYRSGLIALTGKVLVNERTGVFRISFRCAMPLEWLEEAIAAARGCEN